MQLITAYVGGFAAVRLFFAAVRLLGARWR